MRKIVFGALITLAIVLIFRSCSKEKEEESILIESSMLLQKQIDQVAKLVVTEGHFSEVYTYKDSQQLFGPFITAQKKALVVVNAEVTVSYDLREIDFEVDEASKTLYINRIPEPEIRLNPDFEYYDVTADFLNQFKAEDYNKIKKNVNASLMKKLEASSLMSNAETRLLSELSKFYILTSSMEWTLVFENRKIEDAEGFKAPQKN